MGSDVPSRQPELYAALSITWIFSTVTLLLRMYCRRVTKNRLWWDDYFSVAAYVLGVGVAVMMIKWAHDGFGLHIENIPRPYSDVSRDMRLDVFIVEMFYASSLSFSKLSILAFYWRIFSSVRSAQIEIIVLTLTAVIWMGARIILNILHCIPVSAYWDDTVVDKHCFIENPSFYAATVSVQYIHLAVDLSLLLIPALQIKKLRLSPSRRMAITILFSFGIVVSGATVAVIVHSSSFDPSTEEFSWFASDTFIWLTVECQLAIASTCLPLLRPICKKFHLFLSRNGQSGSARAPAAAVLREDRRSSANNNADALLVPRRLRLWSVLHTRPKSRSELELEMDAQRIVTGSEPADGGEGGTSTRPGESGASGGGGGGGGGSGSGAMVVGEDHRLTGDMISVDEVAHVRDQYHQVIGHIVRAA